VSRHDLNTTTAWGGWAKAVLMQEPDLPTVADCCTAAALLEHDVQKKIERIADLEATLRVLGVLPPPSGQAR
jgi:hypothetical protein